MKKFITCFIAILNIIIFLNIGFPQENLVRPIPKGQSLQVSEIHNPNTLTSLASTIIFQETFETGATGWSMSGSWAIGAPTSGPNGGYNSVRCAATNLSGNYSNNADDWLISPNVTLIRTSSASQFSLHFMEWFNTESGYDYGYVKISTNGGATWTLLSTRAGSSDWREFSVDLTPYSNRQIKIAFHFTSDASVTYAGWYVDNVKITRDDPEPITATMTSLNSQNFPFIYMNIAVDTFGVGFPGLTQSNFTVYENNLLQRDYFQVIPPDTSAGVRLTDIVFLMDNSGSMEEEISAVRNNMIAFVNNLVSSGINFALGLCRFGAAQNNGYPIIEDNGILTTDANYFKNTVWARNVTDGSFEPGWDALYTSATSFNFRPGSQKIFILITDESVTGDNNRGVRSQQEAIQILRSNSILTFALIDSTDSYARQDYGPIAQATGGQYFHIYRPFDAILNYIGGIVSNTYIVSYRSSNPTFDGTTRNVKVIVNYRSNSDTANGSYIPGSAPIIQRTSSTIALHNQPWAEGTTFNIEAEIVDNVSPYVQSARLYYRRTGTTTYSSVAMTLQTGMTYRGVIPGSAVRTPGLDYYITATDGISTSSDPRTDPATNPYQLAILPNIAPTITHTPVTTLTPGVPITITATIIDNTNFLATAKLYYRKTGQLIYQQVTMTNIGGNNYQGVIPASYVTTDGVDYYIYAVDNFGVSNTHGSANSPHRIEPLYDIGFRSNPHGWRFSNSTANMWPQAWWHQFNYCQDPYPLGWCLITKPADFPDWPLFVEAFGQDACYLNPPPGLVIYNPFAVVKWFGIKGTWGGSCFGFAISSFLFFDNMLSLTSLFPGNPTVYNVPIRDDSRRLVNLYWIYQFGRNQLSHINRNRVNTTPVATLNDLKQMLLSTARDDRILVFFHQNGSGGHAVNAYKVSVGERIDTVYIYDSNAPNSERRILIDKISNLWDYPDMPNWGGQKGLFLMEPVSNYLTHPILSKEVPRRERHISNMIVDSINHIEIYNSECDASIVGATRDSIGYRRQTGSIFSTFRYGMPIIPITGSVHPPIGYYLPLGSYDVRLSNFADTTMYISVLSDSLAFIVDRRATRPSHTDNLSFDIQANSVRVSNVDTTSKSYNIQSIIVAPDIVKVFGINRCNVGRNDTLRVRIEQRNRMKITNNGNDKTYDVLLKAASTSGELVFEHRSIALTRNSAHLILPQWDRVNNQKLTILIDTNMNGTWDDSLLVDNQYTGGSPPTPGPLSTENVFAYPNPFNPETEKVKLRFKLGKDGNVTITIFDVNNKKVKEVISNVPMSAGVEQSIQWDGRNEIGNIVANGVYFYIIESSSGERAVGKIAVLR